MKLYWCYNVSDEVKSTIQDEEVFYQNKRNLSNIKLCKKRVYYGVNDV